MTRGLALCILLLTTVTAQAQQKPVPVLKSSKPVTDTPVRQQVQRPYTGWQTFKGATSCEQVGNVLTCNNGYSGRVR